MIHARLEHPLHFPALFAIVVACGGEGGAGEGGRGSMSGSGGNATGATHAGGINSVHTGGAPPNASGAASGARGGSSDGAHAGAGGSGEVESAGGRTNPGGGRAGRPGNAGLGGAPNGTGGGNTGGTNAGGASGGRANSGGTNAAGSPGNGGSGAHPCDGSTAGYDVIVALSGGTWTARRGSSSLYSGADMAAAMQAGLNGLTANRTSKQSVLVQGSGTIAASTRVSLGSYTILNVCGTIDVTGSGSGDMAPIYARSRTDIEIPNVKITGSPVYGMFFRDVDNLHLGRIDLRMSAGLGIRIDNNAGTVKRKNVVIDYVYGEGMSSHAVETYGVDNLRIGTIEARDTGECGLLLNNTTNAEVGLVDCDNCAAGTGYAAFRIANDAGKVGADWPAGNIHVGKVVARGGGRGIFSVSGSGGLTIDTIDIADTGNNSILLQNCYNTTIAAVSGTVSGGTVLLSNDTENTDSGKFAPSRDVTFQNLTLSNGASVSEAWCQLGDRGNRARNVTGGDVSMCVEN